MNQWGIVGLVLLLALLGAVAIRRGYRSSLGCGFGFRIGFSFLDKQNQREVLSP
ncbi:MAG: IPTL-CTERM sorting domain-containing protein [Nitrospirota bacterium]